MSEHVSTKKLVAKFLGIEYPDDARKLVFTMASRGIRPIEILMLARAYEDDIEGWEYAIDLIDRGGYIYPGVSHVINEKNIRSLLKTLRGNGLIKDFGESNKELDWFVENFYGREGIKNI